MKFTPNFTILCLFGALCLVALLPSSLEAANLVARVKRGLLTDEAERLLKQASNVDVNNVGQLADLVERNNAEECLSRVICELSHNPKSHGEPGTRFAQSLLKFRQSRHPKVRQYTDAMTNGAKSRGADQCRAHYPRCNHSTAEVVSVGNKLLRTK